ncbi:ATP-binding cassette domain-containing protein [Virgisporangium ochraceum]|uniref:ABC transporter ATP-binding protein n=1 Tax=Virgisporangium ochraceum TaxID=65505 RepID=A0A8J4EJ46_9ACTN|nr:ATP-binding cassette domain-containing protein [Virgisporangium ochraceum]GIJ73917.1 ABC transporter ATP-binding protein [Virgisporangium ochraceum]
MSVVVAQDLTMTYRVPVRAGGLAAALASVVRRRYRDVHAVRRVSFEIAPGEVVGFIGPNGAGKTTTMKLLSGLLHPTSGRIDVLGFTPWQRRAPFLKGIALIRGSQPVGGSQELTVLDALDYQRLLYDVTRGDYQQALTELTDLLELEPLLERQLRALSLGEKMRVGLALALLYRPRVLFLDEPTLGLDVSATATIRRFLATHAEQTGATILLTSHYMADVQQLCERLLLIDHGEVQYDGSLPELSARLSPFKLIRVSAPSARRDDVEPAGEIVQTGNGTWVLRVPRADVARATAALLSTVDVADLAVEEPALEDVIDRAYRDGLA